MKKLTLSLIAPWLLFAGYHASISPIAPFIAQRMIHGHSWHRGCPVRLSDLRYLKMTYHGFDGHDHTGEMVVHTKVANDVREIFGALYHAGYPIKTMKLVSAYGGNDTVSINHDNTSAFNCRAVTGGKKWSKHSYGTAIDINPLENPYISHSGHIAHPESYAYDKHHRTHHGKYPQSVIVSGDPIVRLFKQHGWRWGGDWRSVKDYQHFDKPGAQRGRNPKHPSPQKHRTKKSGIITLF